MTSLTSLVGVWLEVTRADLPSLCCDHRPSGTYHIFQRVDLCNTSTFFFQFNSRFVSPFPLAGDALPNSESDHLLVHIAASTPDSRRFSLKLLYIYHIIYGHERMRPKINDGYCSLLRKCSGREGWRERERTPCINERKGKRVKRCLPCAPLVHCVEGNEREWWCTWKYEGDGKDIFAGREPNPPLCLSHSRKIPKW